MRAILTATTLLLLAACQPQEPKFANPDPFGGPKPPASAGDYPPPGINPPNPPMRPIAEQESRFSILGDVGVVKVRKVVELPDRYREFVEIENGFLRLDRLNKGTFDPRENNYTALRRLITGTEIAESGLKYEEGDVKTVTRSLGQVSYVLASSTRARCFVFAIFIGGNQEFVGSRCLPPGHPNLANLEFVMLDLIGRVRLDDGRISRGKPPA